MDEMGRSARARLPEIGVRRWRMHLRLRRTCADCGFLAYGGEEARRVDRVLLVLLGSGSSSGKSPSGPAERWSCAKGLWLWELGYTQPDWDVVIDEVAKNRRGCRGFSRWKPGWSPAQHTESEERAVDFRRQLILKMVPKMMAVLYGLIGAAITSISACYLGD